MANEALGVNARNGQLQPAEELRRPDRHGQLPHIIMTTSPDLPLHDLTVDDIVQFNWAAVLTAIRDGIVRVKHEGDLSSATLRETIQLVALALKKLEKDDAYFRRQIADRPRLGLMAWFIALWPGAYGQRVRKVIAARRQADRQIKELAEVRDRLFEGRVELAEAVDRRLDGLLLRESEEYRNLRSRLPQDSSARSMAKAILKDLHRLERLEQEANEVGLDGYEEEEAGQIERKLSAYFRFASEHSGETVKDIGDAEVCLCQLVDRLGAQSEPIERAMEEMRNARKQELYGQTAL